MQIIMIAGTIGKNAEVRQAGQDSVAGFSVAVDNGKDKQGNKRDATWYDCSLWGKRGTSLAPYLTKGTKVTISGRPTARCHNDKAYLGVNINEITLQGGNQQSGNGGGNQGQQSGNGGGNQGQQNTRQDAAPENFDLDDEIPF